MSNLMLETQILHRFPHFDHLELETEAAKVENKAAEETDPNQEILQFVNSVRLPTKQEFREIISDKQKSTQLYSTLLDTCEQVDKLTKKTQAEAPKSVDDLPHYWTVLGSPYHQKARALALRQFHAPQSSFFLPNGDEMILEMVRSWNVFPSSILKNQHGRERVLAWVKTFYILERASVRNKVIGTHMSQRHNRKLDGKALTQCLLPQGYSATHQMVKRAVLLRDISKRRGSWSDMDRNRKFWDHYQDALVDLRKMSRHEAEAHLTKLVKEDQENHGKF